jgi:hypothetical protein
LADYLRVKRIADHERTRRLAIAVYSSPTILALALLSLFAKVPLGSIRQ